MKELFLVVIIVTIRLNGKVTFSNICDLGLEAEGKSTEVYFESITFPSLLYKSIGFEVEISHT